MLQSNRSLVSLVSLFAATCLAGCVAETAEQDEFVAEEAQGLSAEICNGIDDDEDFMIDEGGVCDSDNYVYDNHEYLVVQDQLDQATGQAMCEGRGMNLARIQSLPENDFLKPFAVGTQGFWIDLNDRVTEGSYRYENATAATWQNWSQYEPNNYNNEDCAMMWNTGKWNDINCTWTNKTFCELLDPITWTNMEKASFVGTKLTKTPGMSWDAGAHSVQRILSGEGFAQFTTDEVGFGHPKAFGLTSDPQGNNWQTIDYAILLTFDPSTEAPQIQIRENGGFSAVSTNGTWTPGDVFRIEIVAGEVRYLRNGALMHAHPTTPTYPLYADASLGGSAGTSIGDARLHVCEANEMPCIERNMWTRAKNVLAVDGRVKKVAGLSWDAGASTIASVPTNAAYTRFSAPADGSASLAGFGLPTTSIATNNVKYGFLFGKNSAGAPIATAAKDGNINYGCPASTRVADHLSNSDEFRVELIGTNTVVYKVNNNEICRFTAPSPHPTSMHLNLVIGTPAAEINNVALGSL